MGKRWTSDREALVLSLAERRGTITTSVVAELLGLSKQRARSILQSMVGEGVLEKHGNGRYTCYKIPG